MRNTNCYNGLPTPLDGLIRGLFDRLRSGSGFGRVCSRLLETGSEAFEDFTSGLDCLTSGLVVCFLCSAGLESELPLCWTLILMTSGDCVPLNLNIRSYKVNLGHLGPQV